MNELPAHIPPEQVLRRAPEIHAVHLEILREIVRLCRMHEITFTMTSGSLLGTVRHHGPIPWDDDLDIALLTEDYDRFIEACRRDLDKRFFLQTRKTDPESPHYYAKIRANNTVFLQPIHAHRNMHHGIFVDVFPFDGVPNNRFVQKVHKASIRFGYRLLSARRHRSKITTPVALVKAVVQHIARFVPMWVFDWYFRTVFAAFDSPNSKLVSLLRIGLQDDTYEKCTVSRAELNDTIEMAYDGLAVPVPRAYHKHLTQLYGNYMEFPPESERLPAHHVARLEIGTGK